MSEKKGLPRPPFYTNEYIDMAEILEFALDRFGKLILALMYYTADGTEPKDLPLDLKGMFEIYKRKIDFAKEKYEKTCEKNKNNGKNGGRPSKKADTAESEKTTTLQEAPSKKAKTTLKIKMPPTEAQLTKLLEDEQAAGLVSAECDPSEFFEWAETLKWKINGEPAQNVGDFLTYAKAKHPTKAVLDTIGATPHAPQLSHAYGIIFKEFHGLRDDEGNTRALAAAIDFLKAYDGGWNFHKQSFTDDQWKEALDEFMQDLKTE